ncbi:MAG: hypothetical protein CVT84_16825 [Alphaproteobacteria bacterium HGW-Alphaproteobacteria-6]|nr:MAG: hypothetical protein CVT84_16825 [Alphaproteobacteria bacterium HGW-Alphaproteobacteria-6]
MSHRATLAGLGFILVLGACARPEPAPAPIQPQPIYNKVGQAIGCEGGAALVTGADGSVRCQVG